MDYLKIISLHVHKTCLFLHIYVENRGCDIMSNPVIPLNMIILENPFRQTLDDQTMALHVSMKGIKIPLIIEGPTNDNTYILVEGYRRYHNLERIGVKTASCIVEPLTDEAGRVLKRLASELTTKKRTSAEIQQMILYLLEKDFKASVIARETGISITTIRKYAKLNDIDDDKKAKAKEKRVSKDALIILENLQNTSSIQKDLLIAQLFDERIKLEEAKAIEKVTKTKDYNLLSDSAKQKCCQSAIKEARFTSNHAERIVQIEKANAYFDCDALRIIVYEATSPLNHATNVLQSLLQNNISPENLRCIRDIFQPINGAYCRFTKEYDPLEDARSSNYYTSTAHPDSH